MGTITRSASTALLHDWNDDSWATSAPTTAAETLSGTTESKTGSLDCRTYFSVQVTVDINYDATPTDEVTINFYGSVDGTNFDDTPFCSQMGDSGTDPQQLTWMIPNPPAYLQIGFVQDGATDTHEISTVKAVGFTATSS